MPEVTPLPARYPKKQPEGKHMQYDDPALAFPKPTPRKKRGKK